MPTKKRIFIFLTWFLALTTTMTSQNQNRAATVTTDTTVSSYKNEINAWHQRRVNGLKRPYSWLSLVALDWLENGANRLPSIGIITMAEGKASLQVLPDVRAMVGGRAFRSGFLRTDRDSGGPDRVEIGTRAFSIIQRGDRSAIRMWDSTSQVRTHFTDIPRFPVAMKWRIEARWEAYAPPKSVKVPSVVPGYVEDYKVPGVAIFLIDNKEYRLEPVDEGDQTLFFIFADKTNGKETYGAGRFLYADLPKEGKVILDFNKAYNPPCAFTNFATCPLAPASNHLTLRIDAGEMKFGDH